MPLTLLAVLAALTWLVVLLHPARPWRNLHLLPALGGEDHELGDVTVLIPARDEAETLPATLAALARQGRGLAVVVVDDESRDGTAEVGRRAPVARVRVVQGRPPPSGWSGKVWAQHQGEPYLDRPLTLLLDADVALAPGMVAALKARLAQDGAALVSIMARLRAASGVEKLLVPPFIHFFKLLYPFALSNDPRSRVAAAAGGCVLLRTEALRAAGGFAAIHDAVIDDCALARRIKSELNCRVVCTLSGEDAFLDTLVDPYRTQCWEELTQRAQEIDAFIAVSEYYGNEMRERMNVGEDKMHVVLNGINLEGYEPTERHPDPPAVGFLARMCHGKGLATLVDAFIVMKSRDRVPGVKLIVIGSQTSEDEKYVAQQVENLATRGVG